MRSETTTTSKKDRLKKLAGRLQLDEQGTLTLDGERTMVIPASVLTTIRAVGEAILGHGVSGIQYLAGEFWGRSVGRTLRTKGVGRDVKEVLRILGDQSFLRGFGRLEIGSLDEETGLAVWRIYNSPFTEGPVIEEAHHCYFLAGFGAGILSVLTGNEVICREKRCKS